MTDLELLTLAAKAAGIDIGEWMPQYEGYWVQQEGYNDIWNPLLDDGESFHLLVKLRLIVTFTSDVYVVVGQRMGPYTEQLLEDDDRASTRRAIVRATAAIGEKMP